MSNQPDDIRAAAYASPVFPLLVADYIIASGEGRFTPLQVIKLAYISHGFTLALLHSPLVQDEIEAWRYGPVIPALYDFLKPYGSKPITQLLYCGTMVGTDSIKDRKEFFGSILTKEQHGIIDRVLDVYGQFSGIELLKLTHKPGSPWSMYYKKGQRGIVIPNGVIKKHYEGLLASGS